MSDERQAADRPTERQAADRRAADRRAADRAPKNRKRKRELPTGWTKRIVIRKTGVTAGSEDTYYYNKGKRYRSLGAVNEQLEREGKEPIRDDDGNAEQNFYTRVAGATGASLESRDQFAQTPTDVLEWVKRTLGTDALCDPCPTNPSFDGRTVEWHAFNFCNPPYSKIEPWLKKAFEEAKAGKSTMLLLPARTSPMWFHRWVLRAHRIWWSAGGIKFKGYSARSPFGVMLVHVDGSRPLPAHGPVSCSVDFHREESRFDEEGRMKSAERPGVLVEAVAYVVSLLPSFFSH